MGITPRPRRKVSTGACKASATASSSAVASSAPPPATMIGRSAFPSTFAPRSTASSSTGGRSSGSGATSGAAPSRPQVSIAHSSATGPRLPLSAARTASATRCGASAAAEMRAANFVKCRSRPSWSCSSCRWPQPRSMASDGICPASAMTGAQVPYAVSSAAARIQHAGPGHHCAHLRPASRQRGAERHVAGGLLVARMQHAHAAVGAVHRVEQMVVVHAGQRVERVDAVPHKARDDRFGGGHALHGVTAPRSAAPRVRARGRRDLRTRCLPRTSISAPARPTASAAADRARPSGSVRDRDRR